MLASQLALFALVAPAVLAAPTRRQLQYNLYNDGTKGSVTNLADDFGATYHASAFMSRQGCSSSALITYCYTGTGDLSGDPAQELETADYPPYLTGGVGTNQRALLLSETHRNTSGIVTHTVRFHISTSYTDVPLAGPANSVTFVGLRNFDSTIGLKALDVRARTFTGEETAGTALYVAVVGQTGSEAFPSEFPLSAALGRTIEVTYRLGVNGATVDGGANVAIVSAKFVDNGDELFSVGVARTAFPRGIVDASAHRLIFGADRQVSSGMKDLKVWFGDYSATPLPISPPEKRSA